MLELVCNYLERHEPSNPRRYHPARAAVVKKSFLEIVKDLIARQLSQLEKLAGNGTKIVEEALCG